MITLPFETTGKWSVKHGQDFLADIVDSRNMDFSQATYAMLAKKPVVLYTGDNDSDFATIMAIVPLSNGVSTTHYFITTGHAFSWDLGISGFTELSTSNQPTGGFDSDGVIFNGLLHMSGGTKISSFTGGAWTNRITSLSSTYPKSLCVSEHQNYLAVALGNTLALYDTSYSLITTLTIPAEYIITTVRWREGNLYIGTRNLAGNSAKLFVWNGTGTAAQFAWNVKADWIYSIVDALSSIVCLISSGQLLRFNGGGFDEIGHFPIYDTGLNWNTNSALSNGTGRCANRGMISKGDRIYINIDGAVNVSLADVPGKFLHDQPSGLWIYDPDVGLYHHAGFCFTQYRSETVSVAASEITFATAHKLNTGDPVYVTAIDTVTGINASQLYFAIVDSATTIRLAMSRAASLAGTIVTITGTSSAVTVIIDSYTSTGGVYTSTFPGAVGLFVTDNPPSILGSEIMYGASVLKADGSTTVKVAMSLGNGHSVGSFTTSPIPASQISDNFQKFALFSQNIWSGDAKAIIKYRTVPRYGFPTQYHKTSAGLAVWVSDHNFTLDSSAKDFVGSEVGDEVVIIEGAGAGYSAHISNLNHSGDVYIVELDESIPTIAAGQKSEIMVDNWKKLPSSVDNSIRKIKQQIAKLTVGASNSLIQFKVELRGFGVGVRKIQNISNPNEKSV